MDTSSVADWLSSLAARTPAPAGGAAGALAAASSAALVAMVARYTTGTRWVDREARMQEIVAEAERLRAHALRLAADDAAAFAHVSAAYGLPKDTAQQKAERTAAIQQAMAAASQPPAHVAELAGRLVELADELVERGNPNVVADAVAAACTARAALDISIVNIVANGRQIRADTVALDSTVSMARRAVETADQVVGRALERLAR